MKTFTRNYFAIISFLIASLLMILMSSSALANNDRSNLDHAALAVKHEFIAIKMQAKIAQQQDILENKPRTSYLGKNGQRTKKRIVSRIQRYEKAAEENFAKADYHTKLAAWEAGSESIASPGQTDDLVNKAKKI